MLALAVARQTAHALPKQMLTKSMTRPHRQQPQQRQHIRPRSTQAHTPRNATPPPPIHQAHPHHQQQSTPRWVPSVRALVLLVSSVCGGLVFLVATSSPASAESSSSGPTSSESVDHGAQPIYKRLPPSTTPAERVAVAALKGALGRYIQQLADPVDVAREATALPGASGGQPAKVATPPSSPSTHHPSVTPAALAAYLQRWAVEDDWCLLRYCRAHKLHVAKAELGVLATARWRLEEGVDSIRAGEFADSLHLENMHVSRSTDLVGRSLIVYRKSPDASSTGLWSEEVYRLERRKLIYTMERAIREAELRLERGEVGTSSTGEPAADFDLKWIWLVDVGLYTSRSATPWTVTKSLIDVMRLHYPERLSLGIIVDAPWILRSLLKLLRPVIPRVTREKVLFVANRHAPATRAILCLAIGGVENLPVETGIEGAAVVFDKAEYVRSDPLAHPRR